MEIIQIGSDKGKNDNAVIPSEGWDNTPLYTTSKLFDEIAKGYKL